jgi:hypothetical protein
MKRDGRRLDHATLETIRLMIEAQLARPKARPWLIQSFFRAPGVAYITD